MAAGQRSRLPDYGRQDHWQGWAAVSIKITLPEFDQYDTGIAYDNNDNNA